ncbi:MAG: beta-ketoacyl-ACP synthase III [Nitrospirales bacterium]|nr:beta-ketoacyl-ACP synthase III [Nitrospirales bacterium]
MGTTYSSRIIGTGSYLPSRVVDNAELAYRFNRTASEMFRVTGIHSRRWATPDTPCSQLAEEAATQAMVSAGLTMTDIDALIVSTTSPDTIFPSTACHLQHRLNAKRVAAFDVAASCSGFLYGLSMADAFIRSGQFRRCLVVAAEIKSRYVTTDHGDSAMLFGDGAGAVVVARDHHQTGHQEGIVKIRLHADGFYQNLITIPAGGSRTPLSQHSIQNQQHTIQLQGGALFRVAVKRLSASIQELLQESHLQIKDIKQVITHQANGRMLAAIAKRLGLPPEHMVSVIEQYGNTSSASLPIALDHAYRQEAFGPGDLIVLGTFGGGLTWGTALIRW